MAPSSTRCGASRPAVTGSAADSSTARPRHSGLGRECERASSLQSPTPTIEERFQRAPRIEYLVRNVIGNVQRDAQLRYPPADRPHRLLMVGPVLPSLPPQAGSRQRPHVSLLVARPALPKLLRTEKPGAVT